MCGIAGIVSTTAPLDADAEPRAVLMRDVMTHRGPDGAGLHTDELAVLAHRRLSIVDLATGQQPLANEDRSIWVTYNGEIYNHGEIRRDLQARGHRYRTKSDTETVVHAFEEWGDECVDRFRGMFAFGIWDSRRRRLLLVRDRLGVKPLYWCRAGDRLLFASEIKSILASGLVSPEANHAAIPELLGTRSLGGDATMFRGIFKLPPGHLLIFENGAVRTRQYWDVPTKEIRTTRAGQRPRVDAVMEFRSLLADAVRLRLMSEVPLGMFLSGGIDSSAIATIMAGLIDRPLKTFSVAFKERAFNELQFAREVATEIKADAHEVVIDDRDFFGAVPKLVWHEDEPIAHTSSVPLYFVSKLAKQQATVVLTGEGSDELLAGYGKYPRVAWNWRAGTLYERVVPPMVRTSITRRLIPRLPARLARYAGRSFLAMERSPASMIFDNFAAVRLADQRRLFAPHFQPLATAEHAYAASITHFETPNGASTLLDRCLYADIKTYLVELLMKQDQMSMAASIESRVPFLDHKLVEFAAALPDEWKLSGWTTKKILRDAMTGLLPASILNRPKMGFPVPFGSWLRQGWNDVVREVLLDRRSVDRGIFVPRAVDALLRDHAAGRTDGTDRLWALFNLELWYRTFIDQEGIQTLPHAHPVAEIGSVAAA